jgi:Ornithine cyclodeaminase/mu-crystallin family
MGRGAIKWQSGYPSTLEIGLPSIMGLLILNDGATGAPSVVMESGWLTAQRTGAVSAVTARALGKAEARSVALLGCGKQAMTQLEALSEGLRIMETIYLYDVDPHVVVQRESESACLEPTSFDGSSAANYFDEPGARSGGSRYGCGTRAANGGGFDWTTTTALRWDE